MKKAKVTRVLDKNFSEAVRDFSMDQKDHSAGNSLYYYQGMIFLRREKDPRVREILIQNSR